MLSLTVVYTDEDGAFWKLYVKGNALTVVFLMRVGENLQSVCPYHVPL